MTSEGHGHPHGAVEALLHALVTDEPPAMAAARVRACALRELEQSEPREVMTLPEVAEFLRISESELADVMGDLPAFEIGGRIRVRRTALVEWIKTRERRYRRHVMAGQAAAASGSPVRWEWRVLDGRG